MDFRYVHIPNELFYDIFFSHLSPALCKAKYKPMYYLFAPIFQLFLSISEAFNPCTPAPSLPLQESGLKQIINHAMSYGQSSGFFTWMKNSMESIVKYPELYEKMIYFNQLASQWDHFILSTCSQSKWPREHRLILSIDSDKKDSRVFSCILTKDILPDQRIIYIQLGSHWKDHDLSILHEIGHFIGCRQRTERVNLFRDLASHALCNQIYRRLTASLMGLPVQILPQLAEDEPCIAPCFRNCSHDLMGSIIDTFPSVEAIINRQYQAVNDHAMEEPNTTDDMKATIKMGYSYCVLANLLETLYFALPDIENALVQALRKHHPKDIHFDKIMEHLGKVLDQLRMEVDIASPDPTHPKARWLTDLVEQLEEPVADIFMLKMSKISPDRYITLILDNAYDTWIGLSKSPDEQDSPSYLQFISNSVLSSRIISVAVCVGGGKKRAFHQHKHRWIYTPFLRKSQMQMSAIKMLNILIHNEATPSHNDSYASRLQAILNPNFFILPYVKQIYNDTRYNKFKAIPHKSPIR